MKYVAVVLTIVFTVGFFANYGYTHVSGKRCQGGVAKGYATLDNYPNYLPGTIPNRYTADRTYFTVRYNCTGKSVQVRRVDLGTYDVRFPGINLQMGVATVVSDDGGYISVDSINHDELRVVIRGPLSQANVSLRRDLAFSVVVY